MDNMYSLSFPMNLGIGFDEMFDRFRLITEHASQGNYPPYNIVKTDEHTQELQIALAGFTRDDIEVSVERGVLSVKASVSEEVEVGTYVHRGIAQRNVARNWQLADNAVVEDPTFTDGLLRITVRLNTPEELKRKVLPIS